MNDESFFRGLRMQSETEQALIGIANLAVLVFRYYAALVEQGFTVEQAMTMAMAFQRTVFTPRETKGDE